jgi:hypothetical protein
MERKTAVSYYQDHSHIEEARTKYRSGSSPQHFGSVVGTIEQNTEQPITGHSGDHLQFDVQIGNDTQYQVDVNTQSETGTAIELYVAVQDLESVGSNPDEPFGPPAYGVFPNAQLSYEALGLRDEDFAPVESVRLDNQLEAALNQAEFVSVYGQIFDDGGPNGKGIHDTHYTGKPNQDGAIAVYSVDSASGNPKRTWFYFKFQENQIG